MAVSARLQASGGEKAVGEIDGDAPLAIAGKTIEQHAFGFVPREMSEIARGAQ
jgi:hypothetical protein